MATRKNRESNRTGLVSPQLPGNYLEGSPLLFDSPREKPDGADEEREIEGFVFSEMHIGPVKRYGLAIIGSVFRRVVFDACDFPEIRLNDVRFEECDLSNCSFRHAVADRVEFSGCKLVGVRFPESVFRSVLFRECNARYINLSGCRMQHVRFSRTSLEEGSLIDNRFSPAEFDRCCLAGTDFSHTRLSGTDLRGSELAGLRIAPEELNGAIVSPSQAPDLLPLLGIELREEV